MTLNRFHQLITTRLELLDNEVYLKGLHLFDVESYGVSVLRGTVYVNVKKQDQVQLSQLEVQLIGTSRVLQESDSEIFKECRFWDLKSASGVDGALAFPFEMFISSALPETICTAFNEIKYSVTSKVRFTTTKSHGVKQLIEQKPITVMKSALDPLVLESNQIVTEGTFKNLINYQVAISKRVLYKDDTIKVDVHIAPVCEFLHRYKVVKFMKFRLYLLQSYNPDVSHTVRWKIQSKKCLIQEHEISSSEVDPKTGEANFSIKIPLANIPKLKYFNPSFANKDRYAQFAISHFLRSMIVFQEKQFADPAILDPFIPKPIPSFKNNQTQQPIREPDPSLIQQIQSQDSYKSRITELLFKNCIILLNPETRRANELPPFYTSEPLPFENELHNRSQSPTKGLRGIMKKLHSRPSSPKPGQRTLDQPPSYTILA